MPKLLFILQDDAVTDATAHTIASVLSVLLSNTRDTKNLLRCVYSLVPKYACHLLGYMYCRIVTLIPVSMLEA